MRDVAIVGGGPGGLYAATLLAGRGLDVAVFEEHPSTGTPVHCTGVLADEAFAEFDLPRASILNPLHTARFFSPAGHAVAYTTEPVEAVAVDRLSFDMLLFERAARAGASIELGRHVDDVVIGPREATVVFKSGPSVTARAVILACGANYALQRRLGLGLPAMYLQSAQLELPAATPGDVEVHFGRTVAPGGFGWVVPVRRGDTWHARIGLMCEQESAGYFGRLLERIAPRWGVAADAGSPRQKLLPLAPIPRTFANRLLAVGDAAGIVKATTGGGIYYSLLSAASAAETLVPALASDTLDAGTLRAYERSWRRRLGGELEAQQRLRRLAGALDDDDIEAFFELARTDGVMPIVRKTARFNQHRTLILSLLRHPPARRVLFRRLRPVPAAPRGNVTEYR